MNCPVAINKFEIHRLGRSLRDQKSNILISQERRGKLRVEDHVTS